MQESIDQERAAACPESTLQSANMRNLMVKSETKKSSEMSISKSKLPFESTIESANRRGFIRNAALATAAIGLGGAFFGKDVIPTSRASSNVCGNPCSGCMLFVKCNIVSYAELVVDGYNENNGTLGSGAWLWCSEVGGGELSPSCCKPPHPHALTFGSPCLSFGSFCRRGQLSGEGIASARTKCALNRCGLDFYTGYSKRMSITKCGYVGINTCAPATHLYVNGDSSFNCSVYINTGKQNHGTICYGLRFGGGCSGQGIGSNRNKCDPNPCGLDFYTGSTKRVSITNSGNVGIGTSAPSSALDVVGNLASGNGSFLCSVWLDTGSHNHGTLCFGLRFGGVCSATGQGIGSNRCSGQPNQFGLDFYTSCNGTCNPTKRLSITKCGKVGINTSTPATRLCVNGDASFNCSVYINTGKQNHGTICYGLRFGGGCSGQGIGSNRNKCDPNPCGIDFYTGSAKRVSITNSGNVGIGTSAPSSALCVAGHAVVSCGVYASTPGGVGNSIVGDTSSGTGVEGLATCGTAVLGCAGTTGFGVAGYTGSGVGVKAQAFCAGGIPIIAKGTSGQSANLQQWEKGCSVVSAVNKCGWIGVGTASPSSPLEVAGSSPTTVPIVARGASGQTSHLQEWQKSCGTAVAVLTKGGALGIGNNAPVTSLTVNGSVSYKVEIKSANYPMQAYDYAVLGSATSTAGITITLPPAKTALGFLAFIKKVDSNPHAVTVAASGTDKIESKGSTIALNKQYDSLQLMSNGTNEWFIMQSAVCSVATS